MTCSPYSRETLCELSPGALEEKSDKKVSSKVALKKRAYEVEPTKSCLPTYSNETPPKVEDDLDVVETPEQLHRGTRGDTRRDTSRYTRGNM